MSSPTTLHLGLRRRSLVCGRDDHIAALNCICRGFFERHLASQPHKNGQPAMARPTETRHGPSSLPCPLKRETPHRPQDTALKSLVPSPCCQKATCPVAAWPLHITASQPSRPCLTSPTRNLNKNTHHHRIPQTHPNPPLFGHAKCLVQPSTRSTDRIETRKPLHGCQPN